MVDTWYQGRDSHIEWSKAETVQTSDFLIDAQCGYHFHKIMTDIHVAKPVVICSCVVILGIWNGLKAMWL